MRVCAFDIGSNTLLMLIADVGEDGSLTVIRDRCEFGRLGEGVAETGKLSSQALERSIVIVREFAKEMHEHKPERVGAVATQAMRVAKNSPEFLQPAQALLGIEIEVISGEREAELTYRATASAFPELAKEVIVLADVGGASTEVVVGRGDSIESAVSVPVGAVTLAETFLKSDPATAGETKRLLAAIDEKIADLELPSGVALIGTAGTATSFASVDLKLTSYDAEKIQGTTLRRSDIDRQLARFLELTVAEKRKLAGLEPQRADVIAAGAAIYARLMAKMKAPTFVVSGRGVRFGLAASLADEPSR